jgi:hypothetical protein
VSDRNYDYLPDDPAALKDEVAALDRRIAELEAERADAIREAVAAEREAIVLATSGLIGGFRQLWDEHNWPCECDCLGGVGVGLPPAVCSYCGRPGRPVPNPADALEAAIRSRP